MSKFTRTVGSVRSMPYETFAIECGLTVADVHAAINELLDLGYIAPAGRPAHEGWTPPFWLKIPKRASR